MPNIPAITLNAHVINTKIIKIFRIHFFKKIQLYPVYKSHIKDAYRIKVKLGRREGTQHKHKTEMCGYIDVRQSGGFNSFILCPDSKDSEPLGDGGITK